MIVCKHFVMKNKNISVGEGAGEENFVLHRNLNFKWFKFESIVG